MFRVERKIQKHTPRVHIRDDRKPQTGKTSGVIIRGMNTSSDVRVTPPNESDSTRRVKVPTDTSKTGRTDINPMTATTINGDTGVRDPLRVTRSKKTRRRRHVFVPVFSGTDRDDVPKVKEGEPVTIGDTTYVFSVANKSTTRPRSRGGKGSEDGGEESDDGPSPTSL